MGIPGTVAWTFPLDLSYRSFPAIKDRPRPRPNPRWMRPCVPIIAPHTSFLIFLVKNKTNNTTHPYPLYTLLLIIIFCLENNPLQDFFWSGWGYCSPLHTFFGTPCSLLTTFFTSFRPHLRIKNGTALMQYTIFSNESTAPPQS